MKASRINKNLCWIIGGQVVSVFNNFLLLKILTTHLSATEYGYYTLWVSMILFFRQIVYDPISIISSKESKENIFLGVDNLSGLQIIKYLTDRLSIVALLFGLLLIFMEIIFHKEMAVSFYFLLGIVCFFSNGTQGIYINILNILKKRNWASAGIAADSCVKMVLVYCALAFLGDELIYALMAVALSSFLVFFWVRSLSGNFYKYIAMNSSEQFIVVKKLILLSLPLCAPTLLIAMKGLGDKVFMTTFIGVEELAAYNVLLQLGFIPMTLVIGVIQTYISPNIYKETSLGKKNQADSIAYMNKIILKIILLSIFAVIAAYALSGIIFDVLIGLDYLKYSKFLPLFVTAGALAGMSGILNVGVIGAFKPKTVGLMMFFSVSIGLIVLAISIVMGGFEGGATGLILSNFVMLLIFWLSLRFNSFGK